MNLESNPNEKAESKTDVMRGVLNIPLSDIVKDKRSLTRIVNIILETKFGSKDLNFELTEKQYESYISVFHKKRNHFNFNWKIEFNKNNLCGLKIQHLVNVNYTFVNNKSKVGDFINSKNWINKDQIDYEIREVNRQLESLNSRKHLLETYCS